MLRAIFLSAFVAAVPLIAGNSSIGSETVEPESLDELGIHDSRSGYRCPDGSIYPKSFNYNYLSGMTDELPFQSYSGYKEIYSGKSITYTLTPEAHKARNDYPDRYPFDSFKAKFELLIAKDSNGFTEDQLNAILEYFISNDSTSATSYRVVEKKGYDTYVIRNSAGKKRFMSSYDYISDNEKNVSLSLALKDSFLKCTDAKTLHLRSVKIFNDSGDQPGKPLAIPPMVMITDIFFPSININNVPDIDF